MRSNPDLIRSVVCDLDGTLYSSEGLARDIDVAAAALVGASRGGGPAEGRALIECAQARLIELEDRVPSLSRICRDLGIELAELHRTLQKKVRPERHLTHDPVLYALLDSLRGHCDLYIYTNNSFPLSRRIMAILGIEDLFRRVYSIEFCWQPKPDPEALHKVLEDIGGPLESFLFIGDREQIDLTTPAELGIRTLLVKETADLLMIHKLLGIVP